VIDFLEYGDGVSGSIEWMVVLDQLYHCCVRFEVFTVVLLKIQVTVTFLETGTFSEKTINHNIIFLHISQTTVLISFNSFCLLIFPDYSKTSVLFMLLI
jgi:hypothetical protein